MVFWFTVYWINGFISKKEPMYFYPNFSLYFPCLQNVALMQTTQICFKTVLQPYSFLQLIILSTAKMTLFHWFPLLVICKMVFLQTLRCYSVVIGNHCKKAPFCFHFLMHFGFYSIVQRLFSFHYKVKKKEKCFFTRFLLFLFSLLIIIYRNAFTFPSFFLRKHQ